jgi:membrane-bound metal-dependent hydrolase YbcI (DUF457 family)
VCTGMVKKVATATVKADGLSSAMLIRRSMYVSIPFCILIIPSSRALAYLNLCGFDSRSFTWSFHISDHCSLASTSAFVTAFTCAFAITDIPENLLPKP